MESDKKNMVDEDKIYYLKEKPKLDVGDLFWSDYDFLQDIQWL